MVVNSRALQLAQIQRTVGSRYEFQRTGRASCELVIVSTYRLKTTTLSLGEITQVTPEHFTAFNTTGRPKGNAPTLAGAASLLLPIHKTLWPSSSVPDFQLPRTRGIHLIEREDHSFRVNLETFVAGSSRFAGTLSIDNQVIITISAAGLTARYTNATDHSVFNTAIRNLVIPFLPTTTMEEL